MLQLDWSSFPYYSLIYGCIIGGIAICLVFLILWIDSMMPSFPQAPSNLDLPVKYSRITRWLRGKRWLLKGRKMLIDSYVSGKSYMLLTPKNYCVFVSSEKSIKEFASSSKFSLHQAYDDLFSYRYNKLWHDPGESVHMTQVYFFRVLREGLTSKLSALYPYVHETLVKGFTNHLEKKKTIDGGWKPIHHYPFLEYITVSVIGPIFWGETLWADTEFQEAARKFPAQYFAFGEIVQHVPAFAIPLVKSVITRGDKYRNILIERLVPLVRKQIVEDRYAPKVESNLPFVNIIQYTVLLTQGKPYWTEERIILLLESLWRAGGHSVPMTLAHTINALCQHPEYIEPIRDEIDQQQTTTLNEIESLPLLNSFLKEVMRTQPIDSASTRRKALQAHTFSDGTHVPAGNIVCIPSYNIMNDASYYPNPQSFDGFRFAFPKASVELEKTTAKESKVTDVSMAFPFWGYGKEACPGRFFASLEMKSVMVLLISRYEFKLANTLKPATWEWRTFVLPRRDAMLLIRERS